MEKGIIRWTWETMPNSAVLVPNVNPSATNVSSSCGTVVVSVLKRVGTWILDHQSVRLPQRWASPGVKSWVDKWANGWGRRRSSLPTRSGIWGEENCGQLHQVNRRLLCNQCRNGGKRPLPLDNSPIGHFRLSCSFWVKVRSGVSRVRVRVGP